MSKITLFLNFCQIKRFSKLISNMRKTKSNEKPVSVLKMKRKIKKRMDIKFP